MHPLCYYPELVSDAPISDWCASWLTRFPPRGFEQRISRQRQTYRKRELNGRIEQEFLKRVNQTMLHASEIPCCWLHDRVSPMSVLNG